MNADCGTGKLCEECGRELSWDEDTQVEFCDRCEAPQCPCGCEGDNTKCVYSREFAVGVLMPDGVVQDSRTEPRCRVCKQPVPWSRMDEMGMDLYVYGLMCSKCSWDFRQRIAELGY